MFWNRKKRVDDLERKATESLREKCEEHQRESREARLDISEPIKSFLDVSDEWEIDNWIDDNDRYRHVATDTKTGLSLELVGESGVLGYSYAICLNHEWLTEDEATSVLREIRRLDRVRQEQRNREERHEWKMKYQERS